MMSLNTTADGSRASSLAAGGGHGVSGVIKGVIRWRARVAFVRKGEWVKALSRDMRVAGRAARTWPHDPCAVQAVGILIIPVRHPSRWRMQHIRNAPPLPTARREQRVAVQAAPAVVALAETVARAPGGESNTRGRIRTPGGVCGSV
jgi:hypothetical protein